MIDSLLFAFLTFYGVGALLSWLTLRSDAFKERIDFIAAGIVAAGFGFIIAILHLQRIENPGVRVATMLGFLPGAGLYVWFFANAAGQGILALRSRMMGDHKLPMEVTFDRAEAAEKRQEFDVAARFYREAIGADPGAIEPKRRLAELQVRRGDPEAGVRALRALLGEIADPDAQALLLFRLADLLSGTLHRGREAAQLLQEFADRNPGTPAAGHARERVGRIEKRADG